MTCHYGCGMIRHVGSAWLCTESRGLRLPESTNHLSCYHSVTHPLAIYASHHHHE